MTLASAERMSWKFAFAGHLYRLTRLNTNKSTNHFFIYEGFVPSELFCTRNGKIVVKISHAIQQLYDRLSLAKFSVLLHEPCLRYRSAVLPFKKFK